MGHQTNRYQRWAGSLELTLVHWAFPNPIPRAGDIIPSLGKASLPLLGGEGKRLLNLPLLFPLQLADDIGSVSGLEPSALVLGKFGLVQFKPFFSKPETKLFGFWQNF